MLISEIFQADVTRDIPPVIYFHEQKPEKLEAEVGEYIITGGYAEGDDRRKKIKDGIHEQYVHLLEALAAELDKKGGSELPACWISGFYGSGKSSFAKLLGLALDNRQLPDGRSLAEALLSRDDSPLKHELRSSWEKMRAKVDPLAVVFDIGAVARDDEHIHSAVKRQLQERLEYCPQSHSVADFELKLEQDGKYPEFLQMAEKTLGKPWQQARRESLAEDHFSEVMHEMFPTRYEDPVSWLDIRTGDKTGAGTSVDETVRDLESMLGFRAPGKTLFLVVDEVSQYIHANENRMLKLQSFVAALGQRLKGRVWLLATGQQKLEEDLEGSNIAKLKDRFPPRLRVHLAPTNIRDVVHKRLLKKAPDKVKELKELFDQHRPDLQLYGYKCDGITDLDFLEVYPMLPGQVDLLMQITSNLRARSTRVKGDDHAIRGLLQLLGELFRELKLGQQPLGSLLTIDQIYDVQYTALDADVQNTMARLGNHEELSRDELAVKVAKAVALLELIQDLEPTTPELVASCLYARLGAGSQVEAISRALEKLNELGFLSRSEKTGYKIQSSAGQEWSRERDSYGVTSQAISDLVREKLRDLLGQAGRPKFKNRPFPLAASFSYGQGARDERLLAPNDAAVVAFDFHFLTRQEDRKEENWLKESDSGLRRNRLIWVNGPAAALEAKTRELVRSQHIVGRYAPRLQSLPETKRRFVYDEQTRLDHLEEEVARLVAECYLEGELYFRARKLSRENYARNFASVVQSAAEEALPGLYPHYLDLAITEGDMKQLLDYNLSGVSDKFVKGLGILELDSGRYRATCKGEVPTKIREHIAAQSGVTGANLLSEFGGPPCGYAPDVVRACVLGLLRGSLVFLRSSGTKITSVNDPDVQDLFRKDKDFKAADIFPASEVFTGRDRIAIHKFLQSKLSLETDPENEHLADAIFKHFPAQAERLRELQRRFNRLPRQPDVPPALDRLQTVLAKCVSSRLVEDTLLTVKQHLNELADGLHLLNDYLNDLTELALKELNHLNRVRTIEFEQLSQVGFEQQLAADWVALDRQLEASQPWKDLGELQQSADRIQARYREVRADYLRHQEELYEELRGRVVLRAGFSSLTPEQADHVLRPLRESRCETSPEATQPGLAFLRDSVPNRLEEAEEDCNRRLDEILEHVHVVPVKLRTTGQEFSDVAEVDAWLAQVRERLTAQLKPGIRVRIVS